jgi:hypothetical protein
MPRSKELQLLPPLLRQSGNSLPGGNKSYGFRAFDAPALKRRTTEGAEAPYSGAPAVLEYGAVLPTNFLGLPLRQEFGPLLAFSVSIQKKSCRQYHSTTAIIRLFFYIVI